MKLHSILRWCCGHKEQENEEKVPSETPSDQSGRKWSNQAVEVVEEKRSSVKEKSESISNAGNENVENSSKSNSLQQNAVTKPMLELVPLENSDSAVIQITPEGLVEDRDFILFGKDSNPDSKDAQFRVFFTDGTYYISDMGKGTGTFIKASSKVPLRDNNIISFGDNHMIVQMKDDGLVLQFIEGLKNGEKFDLQSKERVLIGRMVDCKIRFDDQNLSRYQCIIQFTEELGWVLCDGDGTKASLNGTWIFAENSEIYDQMVFKSGSNLYKINFIP